MAGAPKTTVPVVVNRRFVFPHTTVLHTKKSYWSYSCGGEFSVEDDQAQCLYVGLKMSAWSGGPGFILLNPSEEALLCVIRKGFINRKWVAYQGAQRDDHKILFEMKSLGWGDIEYQIHLPTNTSKVDPDFTVRKESMWGFNHKFVVLFRNQLIASAARGDFQLFRVNRQFVTVYPGVDQAFIATILGLIELIQEIKNANRRSSS